MQNKSGNVEESSPTVVFFVVIFPLRLWLVQDWKEPGFCGSIMCQTANSENLDEGIYISDKITCTCTYVVHI